ncbi:LruC domain-containing protein [Prevotella sp. tc2-28]|uniref:DUF4842 domain-containing protein n=1 Tax=Prevotella sp. tc2-28 TaxID=1761888 RepID=UPI00089A0DC5|nr:DUF4842 domain-containing protein [Prevotella sp. tc2-28]SEA20798.1 LruC domain-containing protein [Prevotella sp. tc2-28]
MTNKLFFILASSLFIASCAKHEIVPLTPQNNSQNTTQSDQQATNDNAKKILGDIDPTQEWNSIKSGSVTITADAQLQDIVKIQILTESPILNENAKVLAEANVKSGESVTLSYDAPNVYSQLMAACVNKDGVYYQKVFNIGEKNVSFTSSTSSQVARRAAASEAPTFTTLKLKKPRQSFNAQRTAHSSESAYRFWKDSKWENEQMWDLADKQTFDKGWKLDEMTNRGHMFRDINGFADGEQATVEAIVNSALNKFDKSGWNGKRNNLNSVRNSEYFKQNANHIITNGKSPVTLIPIQAFTTEFKQDHIYYYYFKDEDIPAGMSEEDYIKQLPKFKAIQVERVQTTPESNAGTFYRRQEFLLPFFKNAPQEGDNEASAIFPAGYKIGFLNQKYSNDSYTSTTSGCVYGNGLLNYEVNHFGQFLSAMDKSKGGQIDGGMDFTDPRIAMFTANNKTYMCFEEGSDCNFSDMVIEICGGFDEKNETPEPEAEAYTMCFEDRPNQADYDLNDVVIRCIRKSKTQLLLSLVACGGNDDVMIQGAEGWNHNGKEVHAIFNASGAGKDGNRFINTMSGGTRLEAVSALVTVPEGVTIPQYLKKIYIENKTMGKTIKIAQKGEPPFAVIVPLDFSYPMERQCITQAYKNFVQWAQNVNASEDWYLFEESDKIFPSLFKK